jgi:hypothetical protein
MSARLCDTVQDFSKECLLRKKWFTSPVPHLHGKNWAFSFLMQSIKEKIVTAMNSCKMQAIGEGVLYHSLFKLGVSADDATKAVQDMLKSGVLYRSGCAFILSNPGCCYGQENPPRQGTVCAS